MCIYRILFFSTRRNLALCLYIAKAAAVVAAAAADHCCCADEWSTFSIFFTLLPITYICPWNSFLQADELHAYQIAFSYNTPHHFWEKTLFSNHLICHSQRCIIFLFSIGPLELKTTLLAVSTTSPLSASRHTSAHFVVILIFFIIKNSLSSIIIEIFFIDTIRIITD